MKESLIWQIITSESPSPEAEAFSRALENAANSGFCQYKEFSILGGLNDILVRLNEERMPDQPDLIICPLALHRPLSRRFGKSVFTDVDGLFGSSNGTFIDIHGFGRCFFDPGKDFWEGHDFQGWIRNMTEKWMSDFSEILGERPQPGEGGMNVFLHLIVTIAIEGAIIDGQTKYEAAKQKVKEEGAEVIRLIHKAILKNKDTGKSSTVSVNKKEDDKEGKKKKEDGEQQAAASGHDLLFDYLKWANEIFADNEMKNIFEDIQRGRLSPEKDALLEEWRHWLQQNGVLEDFLPKRLEGANPFREELDHVYGFLFTVFYRSRNLYDWKEIVQQGIMFNFGNFDPRPFRSAGKISMVYGIISAEEVSLVLIPNQ